MACRSVVAALVCLAACTARPLDPGSSESTGAGSEGSTADPATSSPPPPTSGPDVTSEPPPPMTTTLPPPSTTTSGPMSTTDVPPPTQTSSGDTGTTEPPFMGCGDFFCVDGEDCENCSIDCGSCPLPEGIQFDCAKAWSGGSMVVGAGVLGPLTGTTAFFGWTGFGSADWAELNLAVFDASVDTAAAIDEWFGGPNPAFTPVATSETGLPFDWVGASGPVTVRLFVGGESESFAAQVTVDAMAGSWDVADPNDPARLLGTIERAAPDDPIGVEGKFDAAFCERFNNQIIPE
ncbi:MAG: hypothetical protein JNL82_41145 [Myxococcales bacterium]|nr:hypothetical protein [Myxococcales bacterium]